MTQAAAARQAVFQAPGFRLLLWARIFNALGGAGFATVIGYQLYEITRDPLSLGWLGLVEAIPALSLALLGGYIADRYDRKRIVLMMAAVEVVCMVLLTGLAFDPLHYGLLSIYGVVFLLGTAFGFNRPATSAFEQQVIPIRHAARGASWLSSVWQTGAIFGGPLAGFAIDGLGIPWTYLLVALLLLLSAGCVFLIPPMPAPPPPAAGETIWQSLRQGIHYVFKSQPLAGSMALDLFAVLFGGAIALLPVFATDILHVGATGLGILRTAPSIGAMIVFVLATRQPPTDHAGRNLLICVAGFGVSMIVFGLSRNFVLSLVALFFSGLFDGVSMIIREVIMRVLSPEQMRGRIASVSWIFVGASNELGALESGVAARFLGTASSVLIGGCVTLLVVAAVASTMPQLRALSLPDAMDG
ncbi:MAG: MFS transporter [Caldilineaceae bacterium]